MHVSITRNGTPLDLNSQPSLFYDELLEIECSPNTQCKMHLYVTISGLLQGRSQEYSVTLYDDVMLVSTNFKEKICIKHPRSPLQNPHLEISLTADMDLEEEEKSEPSKLLLFEPQTTPPSSLLTPFTNSEHTDEFTKRPTETLSKVFSWSTPLQQAIELEMRSIRPALDRARVLAEVNIIALTNLRVLSAKVEMEDGLVELLGPNNLPIELQTNAIYAQCFNLQLRASTSSGSLPAPTKNLLITLECEVNTENKPLVRTKWTPVVDFEGVQGPLPRTPAIHINSQSPSFNSQPNLLEPPNQPGGRRVSTNLSLMSGLSIFITGPQFVKVGEKFEWTFYSISKSQRERSFQMLFGESSQPLPRSEHRAADMLQAYSKYDQDHLRMRMKHHYNIADQNNGVIPLSTGFTVGKLVPQGCFETKIELIALSAGTHTIESTRIRDLATGDTYDVGGLLEVVVTND